MHACIQVHREALSMLDMKKTPGQQVGQVIQIRVACMHCVFGIVHMNINHAHDMYVHGFMCMCSLHRVGWACSKLCSGPATQDEV
jgi:hypothetical protein